MAVRAAGPAVRRIANPIASTNRGGLVRAFAAMAAAALCLLPATGVAAPIVLANHGVEAPKGVKGKVQLGYLATTGNTQSRNLNADFKIAFMLRQWIYSFSATAYKSTEGGQTTAERYTSSFKTDYNFTPHNYLFGSVKFDKDRFSGYDRRTSETAGYGRRIFSNGALQLDLELGAGARQTKVPAALPARDQNEAIVNTVAKLKWHISSSSQLEQSIDVESGRSNTYSESVTSLKSSILGNLYWRLSYDVRHNTSVPPGIKKTDTQTTISLEYDF